jgi:FdhE protein
MSRLSTWEQEHQEWAPYLAIVHAAVEVTADRAGYVATRRAESPRRMPLLDDAVIEIESQAADRWLRRLFTLAGRRGAARARLDATAVLEAAIVRDVERLAASAAAVDADPAAFLSIADVAVMPLLHAARREHATSVPAPWDFGYCPVCAAWPTLAEARGLDRSRRLRCARCGGDWPTAWLRCAFCDNRDHETLDSLVTDATGEGRRVETCRRCRGFVKTVPTLMAIPAQELPLEDLATIELDVAALAHGGQRPDGLGAPLAVRVVAAPRPMRRWPLGGILGPS